LRRYQLVSRETSFVAIEQRETPVAEPAELRRVPIALTRGWGGVRPAEAAHGVHALLSGLAAPAMPRASFSIRRGGPSTDDFMSEDVLACGASASYDACDLEAAEDDGFPMIAPMRASAARSAPRAHDRLVGLQRADGSWDLDESFADSVWMRLAKLEEAMAGATGDEAIVRRALATAVAIAWLERHAMDARVEWELLARKGVAWLRSCAAVPAGGGDWLELGRAVI
jgi:Ca-activated chloride channel homolog